MHAVKDVSFRLQAGERLGIVGESGSGKSVTALAIMGLLDPPGRVTSGSIRLKGRDILALSKPELNQIRGHGMAMIFQNASASLNPVFRIGWQIEEAIKLHQGVHGAEASRRASRRSNSSTSQTRNDSRKAIRSRFQVECSSAR